MLYRFKMAAKWPIFISFSLIFDHSDFGQIFFLKKPTFPKKFFNESWLIVRQHEHIYVAEIK